MRRRRREKPAGEGRPFRYRFRRRKGAEKKVFFRRKYVIAKKKKKTSLSLFISLRLSRGSGSGSGLRVELCLRGPAKPARAIPRGAGGPPARRGAGRRRRRGPAAVAGGASSAGQDPDGPGPPRGRRRPPAHRRVRQRGRELPPGAEERRARRGDGRRARPPPAARSLLCEALERGLGHARVPPDGLPQQPPDLSDLPSVAPLHGAVEHGERGGGAAARGRRRGSLALFCCSLPSLSAPPRPRSRVRPPREQKLHDLHRPRVSVVRHGSGPVQRRGPVGGRPDVDGHPRDLDQEAHAARGAGAGRGVQRAPRAAPVRRGVPPCPVSGLDAPKEAEVVVAEGLEVLRVFAFFFFSWWWWEGGEGKRERGSEEGKRRRAPGARGGKAGRAGATPPAFPSLSLPPSLSFPPPHLVIRMPGPGGLAPLDAWPGPAEDALFRFFSRKQGGRERPRR